MSRCEEMETLVIDQLTGGLDGARRRELLTHLEECPACRGETESLDRLWRELAELPEERPGAGLRQRFEVWLAELTRGAGDAASRPSRRRWRGVGGRATSGTGRFISRAGRSISGAGRSISGAGRRGLSAAALLAAFILGAGAGGYLRCPPPETSELSALRQEVESLGRLVTISLLQQDSASDRLRGVSFARGIGDDDAGVMAALLDAVDHDPNVNVRLAALDALRPTAGDPAVRGRLIASLERQRSPLVQLAVAELLLESDGPAAERALRRLLQTGEVHETVRDYLAERLSRSL